MQLLGSAVLTLALCSLLIGHSGETAAMQGTTPTPAAAGPWCPWGPNGPGPGASNQMPGSGGMMGGQGMMGGGAGPWTNCPWNGMGPGMMGGQGMMGGMMGPGMTPGMMGPGMMGGMMGFYPATATPLAKSDAQQRLVSFAAAFGPDVKVADLTPFASNYYAQLVDGSGNGLAEVLVDRYTGAVYPEPGPNMMWNTRWGMQASAGAAMQYDQAAAQKLAEQFLTGYLPGAGVLEGTAFPGYYTFDFGRGRLEGMLSVNAATGEIWVHTWHGPALEEEQEATPTATS
jgi:hypothetical protein